VLRNFVLALSVVLAAVCAAGQQPATPLPPQPASTQTVSTPSVYAAGPDVTAPQLIPANFFTEATSECKKKDGSVRLAAIVGPDGKPGTVVTLYADNLVFENMAKGVLAKDRFTPGVLNGVPVPVAIVVNIPIQTCVVNAKSADGTDAFRLVPRSQPDQQVSAPASVPQALLLAVAGASSPDKPTAPPTQSKVSAPVPLDQPAPQYPKSARKKGITGVCLIGLIVDTDGKPQNVHVEVSLEPGLDQYAVEAVKRYRFKPAMKGRHPIAVKVNVEVNFP
jgi:TonB family protein